MSWIDITIKPPADGSIIDAWQSWIDENGKPFGMRHINCWVDRGRIYKELVPVNFVTYWMPVPLDQPVRTIGMQDFS